MKIQFIWCWNMWEIILQSIISIWIDIRNITIKTKSIEKENILKDNYNVNIWIDNNSDILILAIKPKQFYELDLSTFTKDTLIISIMAWISVDKIKLKTKSSKIIRTMPNTPMSIWKWVIWYITNSIDKNDKDFFISIFQKTWVLIECNNEDEIDKITSLSWSWPAYYYLFTEIIKNKAKQMWFSEDIAKQISDNTFIWAAKLLEKSELNSEELRKNITSPWGTTESAINNFIEKWLIEIIENSIDKAYEKAKILNTN